MKAPNSELRIGLLSAVTAHLLWGVFPLFWRQFGEFHPVEVVCHRILWAFVFLGIGMPLLLRLANEHDRAEIKRAFSSWKIWRTYGFAGVLIIINWLTFIWAVNHDRVLDASLGYYINPLLNVVLGVLVLRERLTGRQWSAVGAAAIGVAIMSASSSQFPWVSIVLASSFATYALVKKQAPLPALVGLFFETATITLPAIAFLAYQEIDGGGAMSQGSNYTRVLFVLGGTITIMPLALFAFAAHRVPLSTMGVLQYIAPTMQFLIGIWVVGEPFDQGRFIGFAFVWLGLAIYMSSAQTLRKPQPAAPATDRD